MVYKPLLHREAHPKKAMRTEEIEYPTDYESETKGKRKQHCTYCKNHGIKSRKTNHKCKYENCECLLCKLTRLSRLIMRHQQRLWRHLKDTKRREEAAQEAGGTQPCDANSVANGSTKQQKCDMCRNHGEITSKRAHKNACPYQNCTCALCSLTRKRRDIMRHQQRVRRSQVTSKQHNEAWKYVIQAELEILNLKSTTMSEDTNPASSSSSTSPSPVSSSSGYSSFKDEVVSSASTTPPAPVIITTNTATTTTTKNVTSPTMEMPPLEPLQEYSPPRYSPVPVPTASAPNTVSRPVEPLTPPNQVLPSITVKDIPMMESEPAWRHLKRERADEAFKWSPKVPTREENLLGNLDFMRNHQSLSGRFEPQVPMEGINFHDSVSTMDFNTNHMSSFKTIVPMTDASRFPPPTPMKKTRTDENLHLQYNPMFWGNMPIEPRVGFVSEELQHQYYRRAIMNSSSDLGMRPPPGLIPIPQPQHPLRPRPLAPIRHHTLPTGMEWDPVHLHYLACFLQNRGHYTDAMPMGGPFGLPREAPFLHPSVP